jgi:hypothetical protein
MTTAPGALADPSAHSRHGSTGGPRRGTTTMTLSWFEGATCGRFDGARARLGADDVLVKDHAIPAR